MKTAVKSEKACRFHEVSIEAQMLADGQILPYFTLNDDDLIIDLLDLD